MRNINVIIVIAALIMLAACGSAKNTVNTEIYKDVTQNEGAIAEGIEKYYISEATVFFQLDKHSYEVTPACRDAVCPHNIYSCTYRRCVSCIRNVDDKILMTYGDSNKIYEFNQDTYETPVFYECEDLNIISRFYIYEDNIFFLSFDLEYNPMWYIENMKTGERTEVLNKNGDLYDVSEAGIAYISTSPELEFYEVNISSGEKRILSDEKARDIVLYGDRLYYLRVEKDFSTTLCSINTDGTDETELIESVKLFKIAEDRIFYEYDNKNIMEGNSFISAGLDGQDKKILIENVSRLDDIYLDNIYILENDKKIFLDKTIDYCIMGYVVMDYDGENKIEGSTPLFY